jgi:aerobic carbon-monoxide dehydrogenase medium subunit
MDFQYSRASSGDDAVARRKKAKDGAYLAGGMSILPALKLGLNEVSELIDLNGARGLKGIKKSAGQLTIGAMVRHAEVANSAEVMSSIPALAALARGIGDPQVRNRGTIGGSIANNDPAADYPAACLALDATIVTNSREIAADKFFLGLFETALKPGELITAVKFPIPLGAAYVKFPNPATRFALVGVFVARTKAGPRVAVTGAGKGGVFRATDMEAALAKSFTPAAIEAVKVNARDMASDIHAQADYRAHLVKVIAGRAVAACA